MEVYDSQKSNIVSLNSYERETIVNTSDGDNVVRVWTAQRSVITKLRKHSAFTETASGYHGSTAWAEFTIPANRWNPATGAKRISRMTDEQKAAAAARLRQYQK